MPVFNVSNLVNVIDAFLDHFKASELITLFLKGEIQCEAINCPVVQGY